MFKKILGVSTGILFCATCLAQVKVFDGNIKNNSLAINGNETIAIVANSEIKEVTVYNLEKNKKKSLKGFISPRNISFSNDGTKFYVSDSTKGLLKEFNTKTLKETRSFAIGAGAFGFVITPDNKAYINNQASDTVTLIDLKSGDITNVIKGFSGPRQGIVTDNNGLVYVTNFKGDDIRVIDPLSINITKVLTGIPAVRAISVTNDNKKLYGASSKENEIRIIDINNNVVKKSIKVGKEPYGAALSKDNSTLITGNKADNTISVIDTNTESVVKTIGGYIEPRQAIVYSKKNKDAVYVLNKDLSINLTNYKTGNHLKIIK